MTSESSSTDLFFPPHAAIVKLHMFKFLFVLCFLALQGPLIHSEDYGKKKNNKTLLSPANHVPLGRFNGRSGAFHPFISTWSVVADFNPAPKIKFRGTIRFISCFLLFKHTQRWYEVKSPNLKFESTALDPAVLMWMWWMMLWITAWPQRIRHHPVEK